MPFVVYCRWSRTEIGQSHYTINSARPTPTDGTPHLHPPSLRRLLRPPLKPVVCRCTAQVLPGKVVLRKSENPSTRKPTFKRLVSSRAVLASSWYRPLVLFWVKIGHKTRRGPTFTKHGLTFRLSFFFLFQNCCLVSVLLSDALKSALLLASWTGCGGRYWRKPSETEPMAYSTSVVLF